MSDFIWTQALSIGVSAMDHDHQKIINYMNALAAAVERKAPATETGAAFSRLIDFTSRHFADEERYMESIGFPRLDSHKLIHRKLLNELGTYYSEFQHTRVVEDKVFRFLTFWLKSHICGIDRQYTRNEIQAA